MCKVIAIIPARSGSKSIKNKNLKKIKGKSLLERSIEFAKKIDLVDKIIVSTDSKKYQYLSIKYGAECPFLRPKILSRDISKDIDLFIHCLNWLKKHQNYIPDIVINLRPTYPFRKKKDFTNAIKKIIKEKKIESIKSICEIPFPLDKSWKIKKNSFLQNAINKKSKKEFWNLPRQNLTKYYVQNGNIDIVRGKVIMEKKKMSGTKIYPIIQDHFYDIDTKMDLVRLNKFKNF
tara:strand:- start:243 stop:941 length:699 start_codon:yes stop_codon:yes gene_type:complete